MSNKSIRPALAEAAENAVSEHADRIAADVVAAVSNAVDDELGAMREKLDAAQREQLRYMNLLVAVRDAVGAKDFADIPNRIDAVQASGVEYAVRANGGEVMSIATGHGADSLDDLARRETEARVERYRDTWPDAEMVRRTARYGPWHAEVCGSQCPRHLQHTCTRHPNHQAGACRNAPDNEAATCTWDPSDPEGGDA